METPQGLRRKAHFLGTKIKSLRKRNNLTLEDLSVRCVQIDPAAVTLDQVFVDLRRITSFMVAIRLNPELAQMFDGTLLTSKG